MIITIVTDVLGTENNGTTITAKRLISNLKERGYTVRVVSPLQIDEENYYTLPIRSFGIFDNYVVKKNGVELAKKDMDTLKSAIIGSDVVHIILPFTCGKAAEDICLENKIPFTTAFHCQPENITSHVFLKNNYFANHCIYKFFYRHFYEKARFVHCPSEFIKNMLVRNGYKNDLRVISNGVETYYKIMESEKPDNLKDKYCILFIGRFSKEKRHDILIEAVKKSKYANKIQLLFAGCGPTENKIIELGKKLPNSPIIGFYKHEDLVKIINYCDLYVHPADIEIEAIACLEAMTCGLVPVISDSKRSATNTFALHPENLHKVGSSTDLARKIDYFIEHPEVKEKMSKEYIEYAKKFQISNSIDLMEKMFKDAIKYYHHLYEEEDV